MMDYLLLPYLLGIHVFPVPVVIERGTVINALDGYYKRLQLDDLRLYLIEFASMQVKCCVRVVVLK